MVLDGKSKVTVGFSPSQRTSANQITNKKAIMTTTIMPNNFLFFFFSLTGLGLYSDFSVNNNPLHNTGWLEFNRLQRGALVRLRRVLPSSTAKGKNRSLL
jgi:hypothetical protein